jgi:hypothetical protein
MPFSYSIEESEHLKYEHVPLLTYPLAFPTSPQFHSTMSNYHSEKRYEGPEAIVVAMDIGTTQSERGLSGWRGSDSLL